MARQKIFKEVFVDSAIFFFTRGYIFVYFEVLKSGANFLSEEKHVTETSVFFRYTLQDLQKCIILMLRECHFLSYAFLSGRPRKQKKRITHS